MECPKCKSPMIAGKKFWICEDCGEKVEKSDGVDEKKSKKMKLFLSYGHDRNEELVLKIKNDLEKLGHDVWFDKSSIKTGQDWRRAITDGILKSDWFFSFLSKHSTREPGVCLDEIGIALAVKGNIIQTILVESEQEVKPPVSISHIQWLDMHDWYERKQRNPEEFEKWYQEKFQEIVRVIHSDENVRFAGEIEKLRMILRPITMDAFIARLFTRDFTGRQWLVDEINNWVKERPNDRAFVITGKPGIGKSAFLAWLSHYNKANVLASYFLRYNQPEHSNPMNLIKTIAFQLAARLPDYRRFLLELPEIKKFNEEKKDIFLSEFERKNLDELFSFLISEPLKNCIEGGRNVGYILIDALDESPEVAELIARNVKELPQWIKLITTTRPDSKVMPFLKALNPKTLDANDVRNKDDIASYLRNKLAKLNPSKEVINKIVEKSEGIFLYAVYVAEQILEGKLFLDRLDELPEGLKGIYAQYFKRQFPNEDTYKTQIVPVLQVIFAALEPLKIEELREILDYTDQQIHEIILSFGSLFEITDEKIYPFHRTLFDWATSREDAGQYYVSIRDGHVRIAEKGYEEVLNLFKSKKSYRIILNYYLKWLPMHFIKIEEYEKAVELLKDFNFMMERLKAGYLEALLQDYSETIKYLPDEERFKLEIEEAFFREKAHILRRGNEGWPSYKIFFQLAIEHADDSPLTKEAEKYLEEGKVNWLWLRRNKRPSKVNIDSCIAVFEGHNSGVIGAIELSDGRILSWGYDNTLRIWNKEGKLLKVFEGPEGSVIKAVELRDGRIITTHGDGTLRIRNNKGELIKTLEGCNSTDLERFQSRHSGHVRRNVRELRGHLGSVKGVMELKDGEILSWGWDSTLRLWDNKGNPILDSNGERVVFIGHKDMVIGALQLRDGRILSWSRDSNLIIWNKQGKILKILKGHNREVLGALELRDGRILSWSYDCTLRFWDQDGNSLKVKHNISDPIYGALELSDESILTFTKDKEMILYDKHGNKKKFFCHIYGAIELKDGKILAWDKNIHIWNKSENSSKFLKGHESLIDGALELSDGSILTWSRDKTLRRWDIQKNSIENSTENIEGHKAEVVKIIPLQDNKILSLSTDKTFRIWSKNGEPIKIVRITPQNYILTLDAVKLDDNSILLCTDSSLQIYDLDGKLIKSLEGHIEIIRGITKLKDGRILSWSQDGNLIIWDKKGESKTILKDPSSVNHLSLVNLLSSAEFGLSEELPQVKLSSPVNVAIELRDGKILSGYLDGTLILWTNQGKLLKKFKGHEDSIDAAIELANGEILSWGGDKTFRWWGKNGNLIRTIKGPDDIVSKAVELKDGRILFFTILNPIFGVINIEGDKAEFNLNKDILDDDILKLFPENLFFKFIYKYITVEKFIYKLDNICLLSMGRYLCLINADINAKKKPVCWHGTSEFTYGLMRKDGTVIVGQKNGQLCFLKIYKGNQQLSLDELKNV